MGQPECYTHTHLQGGQPILFSGKYTDEGPFTCTDTAKVPLNTPKCTEKPQEMYMNVKIL